MWPVRSLGMSARRAAPWLVERRLTLALGLLAALPVIASTARAVAVDWTAMGDDAVIAIRAIDVLTLDPPLLGQFSASSGVVDEPVHSLGPMLYWLLALPARFGGSTALVITAGVVNVLCIVGVVALARRRGGFALMVATAAAVALMCNSFVPDSLHAVWNPYAALMPFALLVFVSWSIACGDHRLLPLAVLLASFVAQCHLTYVLPALGLLGVAAAGLATHREARRTPHLRRWLLAAALVGLACWSAPLVEQAVHRPGNLALVLGAARADEPTLGTSAGLRAVAHTAGVPPWWLRPPRLPFEVLSDVREGPAAFTAVGALLAVAATAGVLAAGVRRRRRDVVAAAAIGLTLLVALGSVAAATPTRDNLFISVAYTLRWGSIAGMWTWLTVAWSVASLAGAPGGAALRPPSARASVAGAAAVAAVAVAVAASTRPDVLEGRYAAGEVIASTLEALPGEDRVLVGSQLDKFDMHAAAAYALRRSGWEVAAPDLASRLGSQYRLEGPPPPYTVRVDDADRPVSGEGRVIARVVDIPFGTPPPFPDGPRTVVVRLAAP